MRKTNLSVRFCAVILSCLIAVVSHAADYYWVGGSGHWSDYSHHWATTSGGTVFHSRVPTPNDNTIFDAASFTAPGQIVTVDQSTAFTRDFRWAGATHHPTFSGDDDKTLRIYGSLTFIPAMTYSFGGKVNFEAASLGQTITTAGKKFLREVDFRGSGGEWILQDDFSIEDNFRTVVSLTQGRLNTNGKTFSVHQFISIGYGIRTLVLGASTINIFNGDWWMDGTGLTINAGTSTINMGNAYGAFFRGGGHTYHALTFSANYPGSHGSMFCQNDTFTRPVSFHTNYMEAGTNQSTFNANVSFWGDAVFGGGGGQFKADVVFKKKATIYGNNTFHNLMFSPGYTYTLESGKTQTLTGELKASGNGSQPVNIQSYTAGTPATIEKLSGTVCLDYAWISDITATGGAVFNAGKAPERSFDLGGNAGWLFTGGCSSVVLPVRLLSFTVACSAGGGTGIRWRTDGGPAEVDFTVERSSNAVHFQPLALISKSVQNGEFSDYAFTDAAGTGKQFYRLKQRDKSGRVIYSPVVAAACHSRLTMTVHPNPGSGLFVLWFNEPLRLADVVVFDAAGRNVFQTTARSSNRVEVFVPGLPKGVYYVRAAAGDLVLTQPILVR